MVGDQHCKIGKGAGRKTDSEGALRSLGIHTARKVWRIIGGVKISKRMGQKGTKMVSQKEFKTKVSLQSI
jgi:hypothetical protein